MAISPPRIKVAAAVVFHVLLFYTWFAFWTTITGRSHAAVWEYGFGVGAILLVIWSFVLRRAYPTLEMIGLLSFLAIVFLSLALPGRA